MRTLISNVTIVTNDTGNRVLTDCAVAIDGAYIRDVGPAAELAARYPDYDRLDGSGRVLMPGFVNVHMHFYGTYARGLALKSTPHNFGEILQQLWWALDKVLDDDAVYYSTLLPAMLAAKKGVTSVIDHHASPNAVAGSLDRIEEALALVGLRGLLCYEVSDRDGPAIRAAGIAENARYIRRSQAARQENADHLFDGMMGLHASFTLDDETLAQAAGTARDLNRGCHIHLLEDWIDETESRARYGAGAVARLQRFGVLGAHSIAAHGIFLDEAGQALMAETDTIIAHNAQSNMNNAVGRADVFALLERGVLVGIGTDGMTPDLRAEVRAGYLMHKHHLQDCNAGWDAYKQMTLHNNPAIYQRLTSRPVGQIVPGYLADLILLDYYPPTPLNSDTLWGHFLFGLVDAPVDTTIVNGEIVLQGGQLPHLDEAAIAAESRVAAERVWARFGA